MDDTAPRPEIRRRAKPGSIVLRILAFAAVLATVGFLYTQTLQNRQSSASFDSVRSAVLQTLDLADMQEADAQMVRRLYGFAPSEVDGCLLYYPSTNMGARELLIVKLSDLSQQKSVSDAIQARKQTQMKSFEGYGIEQYDLLSNSIVEVQGNYIPVCRPRERSRCRAGISESALRRKRRESEHALFLSLRFFPSA